MMQRPQPGDVPAWLAYWEHEGQRNRERVERGAQLIRQMKDCDASLFDALGRELRAMYGDDALSTIDAIRDARSRGVYSKRKKGQV